MDYRIARPDALADEFKRIAAECVRDAAVKLRWRGELLHQGVHETRKRCKEVRALLRLLRSDYPQLYCAENRWFRDRASQLADLRDARALLEICTELGTTLAPELDSNPFPALEVKLAQRLEGVLAARPDIDAELARLAGEMGAAMRRLREWPLANMNFASIGPGLQDSYRAARTALTQCQREPKGADFHLLRKRVKEHDYHILLLRKAWPQELEARAGALKTLAEDLGSDHDLVVLSALLAQSPGDFGGADQVRGMEKILRRRRRQLRRKVVALGGRLFAEKPRALTARLGAYWGCWEREL